MKKFFSLIAAGFASFVFVSCFNITQTFSRNPDGTFYSTATCSFEKEVLELAELNLDDLQEELNLDELKEEYQELSVTDDDEHVYIFVANNIEADSPAAPIILKDKIIINLNGGDSSQGMLDFKQDMDDPGFQEIADIMFEDYNWTINIDKSIVKKIKKAKLCDDEGNGFDVPVKKDGGMFVISFPMLSIFQTEYYITKLELYK